jgi:hypothetical protein
MNADIEALMLVRWAAEDAVEEIDPQRLLLDCDLEDDVPF